RKRTTPAPRSRLEPSCPACPPRNVNQAWAGRDVATASVELAMGGHERRPVAPHERGPAARDRRVDEGEDRRGLGRGQERRGPCRGPAVANASPPQGAPLPH